MAETLLFEIGVEELPASFVDAALAALPELAEKKLAELRLAHGAVRALGTPRRLALLIDGVAAQQSDLDEELVGPPEAVAFKDGVATKAAEAFAQKVGVPVGELRIEERGPTAAAPKQKQGRYLIGRKQEAGQKAAALLGPALAEIAGKIPFRKSMRWGSAPTAFGRPVQWLLSLYGGELLPVEFAGKQSGRSTRGHRFLAPESFELGRADDYEQRLQKAHVVADRDARAALMMQRVNQAAEELGGKADDAELLFVENATLVEEPFVVRGSFEPRFLELPASVIRAVARGHQRYFCIERPDGSLLPSYVSVVNTANQPATIAKGQDRVMRARLSDASFFFEEDKKVDIEARVEKLSGIVFHNKLGTVREKVARLESLAVQIAARLGADHTTQAKVQLAAHLCKFDLVSLMVGEFPELQGEMGRAYASLRGIDAEVCAAIEEHYKPAGASDALPSGVVALSVALADRLDTLAGCFGAGLEPTGAADPYALRRNDIAVLRLLLDGNVRTGTLDLGELFGLAYDGFADKKLQLSREATVEKLLGFTEERLRGLLAQRTESGGAADAVLAGIAWVDGAKVAPARFPGIALARASALASALARKEPWLDKARTVAKRLSGISKSQQPVLHGAEVFSKQQDKDLVALVGSLDAATGSFSDVASVESALRGAESAAVHLDGLFENTLVNDPDDSLTPRRLEVLSYGASCMLRLGDFGKLAQ